MTGDADVILPLFSVVVPCFNRSAEVKHTLHSIRAQTIEESFECIVVDDGSTDAQQLWDTVKSLDDSRFRYVRQSNQGGGAARNTGIKLARGRYIAFLDSDDVFLPQKLERVRSFLEETGCEAAYSLAYVDRGVPGSLWLKPDRGIRSNEDMGEYLFVSNQVVQTSTIVVTTEVARRVMFDPTLRKGQDLDFCVRAHAANVRFTMIDEPLIIWRDATEIGRTSRHSGASGLLVWLDKNQSLLTRKAFLGYRATVVAVFRPKWQFPVVARDLILGMLIARVPIRVTLRQSLRFALPRSVYRRLVDLVVRLRGRALDDHSVSPILNRRSAQSC
ncbi:glycosyltransferase family 2 protein [Mycolicibacterium doricum]|uniref:glycosyltransferase family 2 protein n=1 Tax=Mycolicibacterium doricum TaxID=126673 RepID=UPI000A166D98|nr:glycosyltransferase family 2 protein [Mycolicibacterium doricum]MCV7269130.1 glycosyltransferase family 2 protein [Mycolicibacterium doricum]